MRQLFLILTASLSLTANTYGQDSIGIGVEIPKDDGSPSNSRIVHMWVGLKNCISSVDGEIIKIWAENGKIDTGGFLCHYLITPLQAGKVTIYARQFFWTGKMWDTTSTINYFTAIVPPDIKIQITKDNFQKDSTIQFKLVDNKTGKAIPKRYQVGRMYEPPILSLQDSLVGRISLCFGTTISKSNFHHFFWKKKKIESGYKMKLRILVRDMETDLLIPTQETIYTFK